jgi:hypothetical protein
MAGPFNSWSDILGATPRQIAAPMPRDYAPQYQQYQPPQMRAPGPTPMPQIGMPAMFGGAPGGGGLLQRLPYQPDSLAMPMPQQPLPGLLGAQPMPQPEPMQPMPMMQPEPQPMPAQFFGGSAQPTPMPQAPIEQWPQQAAAPSPWGGFAPMTPPANTAPQDDPFRGFFSRF